MRRLAAVLALLAAAVGAVAVVRHGDSTRPAARSPRAAARGGRVRHREHGAAPRRRAPHVPMVRGRAARREVVPILEYHVIGHRPPGAPFPQLWITPRRFAGQLRTLAARGYHPVTLARAWAAWRRGAPLPRRAVVLSFDDGYRPDATVVAPLLRRRGWPAVLNLEIHDVGPRGLPLAGVRRLVRDGWEIDSHTVTHPDLTTVGPGRLRAELVRSRAWIRRVLGVRARFFCYPAGRYDAAVEAAVRAAGYAAATTEDPGAAGAASPRFALPRLRVEGALPRLG